MTRPLTIWLPAVRAGSGADVFTERLAVALGRRGLNAIITWFPHWMELAPDARRFATPPAGVDIIHANSAYAFAFKRKGIPLVITEHHYILDPAYRPYKSLAQQIYHRSLIGRCLRRSYAVADAITTDSCFTADVLSRVLGVTVTKTIPLWVDYAVFSPGSSTRAMKGQRNFRLLYVGNASKRKGADVIPLLAQRLDAGFEIRCTAGLRARRQGAERDNVTLLGRLTQDQLISEYRDCDAVLVPSRYEGFGYSALEAMACAKPVVGFRCSAIEEVVVEDGTALLCNIDDMDMLEANCRRLAQDQAMVRQFGTAGRERAVSAFSEARAIDAYLELYRSLLTDRNCGGNSGGSDGSLVK